jgi:hypothetical protein
MATETTAPVPPTSNRNRFVGLLVYSYPVDHDHSKSAGIMISSLLPLVELAAIYAITRRIDDFGVFTFFTMALTLLSFLAFNSPKALLYKDSAIRIVLIGILSVKTMVGISNVLIYTMVGLITALTIWYGRRRQAQAERKYGSAESGSAEPGSARS